METALASRRPGVAGLIDPSDRRERQKAESFFRALKIEEVHPKDYSTFEEAQQNVGHFHIEEIHDKKRLQHSSLGYLPPVEFEAQHAPKVRS